MIVEGDTPLKKIDSPFPKCCHLSTVSQLGMEEVQELYLVQEIYSKNTSTRIITKELVTIGETHASQVHR